MRVARWGLLASVPWLLAAAPSGVPYLDVRTTCSSRAPDLQKDTKSCLRSEQDAKTELAKGWAKIPAAIRETCLSEVKIGGSPSYVELLTCAQMNEWSSAGQAKVDAKTPNLRR